MILLTFLSRITSIFMISVKLYAPAPWQLALNYETKQCAGYWSGDEFFTYSLPNGWHSYEWQYSEGILLVETDIGSCRISREEVVDISYEEACCIQFGYPYISENIGVQPVTSSNLTAQADVMGTSFEEAQQQNNFNKYFAFPILTAILVVLLILLVRELKIKRNDQRND